MQAEELCNKEFAFCCLNRLKAAGADENTLAYVQENIDLRHAADRPYCKSKLKPGSFSAEFLYNVHFTPTFA